MITNFDSIYEKNTVYEKTKDGRHTVTCKKGLWGVSAASKLEADKMARHYFWQYLSDGEYN